MAAAVPAGIALSASAVRTIANVWAVMWTFRCVNKGRPADVTGPK
jgi:hypothetical protein